MNDYQAVLWEMLHSPLVLFILGLMLFGTGYILMEEYYMWLDRREARQHKELMEKEYRYYNQD